jgi:VWFA-related protein
MRRARCILILAVCSAFGQPTPAKFVTFDIVAVGARGQAIPDLSGNEIEVFDNKRAQSIVYLHSGQQRPEIPHVTVVLFSLENAGIKSVAWNEAVAAMRRFEDSEYLYLYVVTKSAVLIPVHALPKPDADSPPANLPWMATILPQFESSSSLYQAPWEDSSINYSPSKPGVFVFDYSQYAEFATRLTAFPGRKSLVCIGCLLSNSSDWDATAKSAGPAQAAIATQMRQLGDAFRQARVAIYPVDGWEKRKYLASQVGENIDDLIRLDQIDAFAGFTGGRAYAHGEIEQAITQAVKDGWSSYRIAYLPPAENWDGRLHHIKVASTRKDVRVLAPNWYLAEPLEDAVREWKPPIPDFAITSPFDQTDMAVSVSPPERAANAIRIRIHLNAADVLLLPRNGRYSGDLALQAFCYTPEGRKLACTRPLRFKLDLNEQERKTAMRGGLQFPIDLPPAQVADRVRVVVHDADSGATGSCTFFIPGVH